MNRRTALLLLGAACLFALMNQSSAAKGKPASDVQNADAQAQDGKGDRWHGRGGFDFRKEVEQIFDKYGVDTKIRDNILNDIKTRMEQIHKEKGGFRKRRKQTNANTEDKTEKA